MSALAFESISRTEASLAAVTNQLPRVTLTELNDLARLQTRVDTKYLISPEQMVDVLYQLDKRLQVLEIDGERSFGYESVYFDTTALRTFRDHKQGRRLRFKVRTRLYENSGECMLEVKVKNRRGGTVKRRMQYPPERRFELTKAGATFVADVLHTEYGEHAPELVAALVGRYKRTTLVDPSDKSRITCDTSLDWREIRTGGWRATPRDISLGDKITGPDMALIETKSEAGNSNTDLVLRDLGIRPTKISKYAVGTALLHPHLAANKWNRLLRNDFGWRREPVPLPA